jgi:nucleoside-diphosphate-sugar epimerase
MKTRSFLYVDECVEAVRRLMNSSFAGPLNIGSDEIISINKLVKIVMDIAGKKPSIKHIPSPMVFVTAVPTTG